MTSCPKCGGVDIAMILYGFPPDSEFLKEEMKKKKFVLGGPVVSHNSFDLECNDCKWRLIDDY